MFALKCLGGASIEGEGGPLSGPAVQRHRLALLALLAVAHPRGLSRDKLIALLWPERDAERGRNLLHQAVHALRKALGEEAIVSSGDELRLEAAPVAADVIAFGEALAASEPGRAVELYTGAFLDGFFLPGAVEFERWVEGERGRLRREYLRALEGLAEEAESRGDRQAAVDWWRRAVTEEPQSSRLTLRLMEALEAVGDRAAAIRRAEAHGELLARELDAEPSPEVTALAARMRAAPRGVPVLAGRAPRGADRDPGRLVEPGPAPPVPAEGEGTLSSRSPPHGHGTSPSVTAAPRLWSDRRKAVTTAAAVVGVVALLSALWLRPDGSSPPGIVEAGEAGRKTVAVLPFEDLTEASDDEAFTRGVHGDLITALSGIGALRVISPASVSPYGDRDRPLSEIAAELGADVVVEGGVQRLRDRVRMNVQLTDPGSGQVLWADSYSRELSMENLFAIQGQIAERIASSLAASLTAAELARLAIPPTESLTAYQYYHQTLLGFHTSTLAANEEAVRLLRLALGVDPTFAPAWAGLASAYGWRAPYLGVPTSAWDSAMVFARRAVELDPDHAGGYTAMAVTYGHQGFLALQEEAAREALERNPSDALAVRRLAESHRERGEFPDALRLHQESVRLSPHELVFRSWVGHVYSDLDELARAEGRYRAVLTLSPDYFHALSGLAAMHLRSGRRDSAAHYARRMAARHPEETIPQTAAAMVFHYLHELEAAKRHAGRVVEIAGDAPSREANTLLATTLLGFAELRTGNPERARSLFEQSHEFLASMVAAGTDTPRWPYEIALIHSARGEADGAMKWLQTAYDLGFRWAWMLELEPMLDPLRPDPRFHGLLARTRADVETMRRELEREEGPPGRR